MLQNSNGFNLMIMLLNNLIKALINNDLEELIIKFLVNLHHIKTQIEILNHFQKEHIY